MDQPRGAILLIANGEMEVNGSCCRLCDKIAKLLEPGLTDGFWILVERIKQCG